MNNSDHSATRRHLLVAAAVAGVATAATATTPPAAPAKGAAAGAGGAVLTLIGPGVRGNRGAFNPARDVLLRNRGIRFDSAWSASSVQLSRLTAVNVTTPIEYDEKPHGLRGPLLATVLQAAGVNVETAAAQGQWISLYAVDGYTAQMSLAQALQWRVLLATSMDGTPLELGGLGPQWAIYDSPQIPELAAKPLKERFAQAPWGLYLISLHAERPKA